MITLYNMDVMKALKQIPSESVDMQITSPPYWGLRDYGVEGQIGLEPDFNDYIKRMCDIFDEVKRVLKKDGTCWVNLGDTYYGSPSGLTNEKAEEWDKKGDGMFGRLHDLHTADRTQKPTPKPYRSGKPDPRLPERLRAREQSKKLDYKAKCVMMIPERFALEMINRGWILRNKIIWHKPNHMPTSVKDRFANSWEYLFMFSKSKKYYFDLDAVRESHKDDTPGALHDLKRMQSGRQEFKGIRSDCKYCGGTGVDPKTMNKCEDCKGKGKLFDVQKSFVAGNSKGKNPDDIINSKYEGTSGHSYRQGFQREPSFKEKRVHQIIQLQIAEYLRKYITKIQKPILDKEFGKHTWTHWIRTDESGTSLPSPEDWIKLKEILNFNNRFDKIMTETEVYLDDGLMWKNKPKNPSDFWNITTQPYKEAHFAVFPEMLVERPIKTTPKYICKKCGKSKVRITEERKHIIATNVACNKSKDVYEKGKKGEDESWALKNRWHTEHIIKGWTSCKCKAGFRPAVILDIFTGSGTTLKVARDLKRDSIGIEIKPEYCDLIYKRLFGNNKQLVNSFKLIKGG